MATNVYNSKQVIDFNPDDPSVCFGYYISGTSYSMSTHPFGDEARRQDFEKQVDKLLAGRQGIWHIPAFLAFSRWGESETDTTWGDELLLDELRDLSKGEEDTLYERLIDLADNFDEG